MKGLLQSQGLAAFEADIARRLRYSRDALTAVA